MKQKLDLIASPILCYQHHIYPLAILLQHECCKPWFYSNYIQLEIDMSLYSQFNFFYLWYNKNPWFYHEMISKDTLEAINVDFIRLITASIDSKKYVETQINEFYIPDSKAYNKENFIHDVLIYGYDDATGFFNVLRYNNEGVLSESLIAFSDFLKAFMSAPPSQSINFLKKREVYAYDFDIQWVIQQIEDYLYSKNTYERLRMFNNPPQNKIFGINTYRFLIDYIKEICNENFSEYDVRSLQIFYEHKKCMADRINYMCENSFLKKGEVFLNAYDNMQRDAFKCRNMLLKLEIKGNVNILNKIAAQIEQIYENEMVILPRLLEELRAY
ncbi:hypothetical protein DFR58_11678 [Anaerobacterium chartisolvens]|uniref:Butirosin biosynthesis protein H-like n=1 Tax=Anaerobacterium chartisolvens TaxID=1297424 RepID=A0A369AWT4_9FIRM|nr:hypothetical protein [Anaerobacterium chartisolvens]RCX13842.1 hypothetical protein DFR58_11678 [Anaerobacterium chartisolvens]